jgi:hypothetical protein
MAGFMTSPTLTNPLFLLAVEKVTHGNLLFFSFFGLLMFGNLFVYLDIEHVQLLNKVGFVSTKGVIDTLDSVCIHTGSTGGGWINRLFSGFHI